jgi:nicotinamide-nucleotide amidase
MISRAKGNMPKSTHAPLPPPHAVELLTIGSELLLGEIADSNARFIARSLRERAFDLHRISTVGDDSGDIAEAIRQAARRASIILTTGGLGPTVDDPTRAAAAAAAGVCLEFHPQLWEAIQTRFQRNGRVASDNNRQQAYLPEGAVAIPNPVGTAPGFCLEIGSSVLIAMPGVPAEMERMLLDQALPFMQNRRKDPGAFLLRTLHVGGLGESVIDERIGDWERSVNPVVGLAAHSGLVDVRITARGTDDAEADDLLRRAETDIRAKLEGFIFGADGATLAEAVLHAMPPGKRLAVMECGTRGALSGHLEAANLAAFGGGSVIPEADDFPAALEAERSDRLAEYFAAIRLVRSAHQSEAELFFFRPEGMHTEKRAYAPTASLVEEWAVNHLLFFLWRSFQSKS